MSSEAARPPVQTEKCFIKLGGYSEAGPTLHAWGCAFRYRNMVESRDVPALFRRWGIAGDPPALMPYGGAGENNILLRVTWFGSPHLPFPPQRWQPPTKADCTEKLAGTDACRVRHVDPHLFKVADYIRAASGLVIQGHERTHLRFYWDTNRTALLAVYEPRDLYIYAVFFAGEYQIEASMYDHMRPYLGAVIAAIRREFPRLVDSNYDLTKELGGNDER